MIVLSPWRSLIARSVLLALGVGGVAWAAAIDVSGGIIVNTGWGRVSSRNPVNPFLIGAVALLCYVAVFRRHAEADVRRASVALRPRTLAAVLAVVALAIGIRWGTFVATGADASGYVSQAELWLHGQLTTPLPEWARDAEWPNAVWSATPLGYRPGEPSYSMVPTYSPGLPMVMAAFQAIGGRDAVYYVVPCFGALTVWVTYLLGARLAGPWAGLLGALLMLVSPTFLIMLIQPMSDVPAAALWGLALWAASRGAAGSAAGAGVAVALAILIRPNVAPLAGVIALVLWSTSAARVRDLAWFAAAAVPGAIAIALINANLYGSPLRSGYGPLEALYALDRVWPNFVLYGGWLIGAETPLMLLGLTAPFVLPKNPERRRPVTLIAIVFPLAVFAHYLPYFVFEVWWYLRFLLPAYPPLLAATGAVIVTVLQRMSRPVLPIAVTALIVCGVALHGVKYSDAFILERQERRYMRVADYVAQLPDRSVFVTLVHSGSIRYYTGRDVLRWEWVEPWSLDPAIAYLRARGHDVYVIADDADAEGFRTRFANTRTLRDVEQALAADLGNVRVYAVAGSSPIVAPPMVW